ncbi:hypothetical protein R3P38DRAFT_2534879, partial [Favolaschia claudopus]
EIHQAGIMHRDLAPRNIIRRARGSLCIIDFETASLNHKCPGETCSELSELHQALDLNM